MKRLHYHNHLQQKTMLFIYIFSLIMSLVSTNMSRKWILYTVSTRTQHNEGESIGIPTI